MREIVIDIAPDGKTTVEALGFKGKGCTEATKAFETALGRVDRRKHKAEFHQTETVRQRIGAS